MILAMSLGVPFLSLADPKPSDSAELLPVGTLLKAVTDVNFKPNLEQLEIKYVGPRINGNILTSPPKPETEYTCVFDVVPSTYDRKFAAEKSMKIIEPPKKVVVSDGRNKTLNKSYISIKVDHPQVKEIRCDVFHCEMFKYYPAQDMRVWSVPTIQQLGLSLSGNFEIVQPEPQDF